MYQQQLAMQQQQFMLLQQQQQQQQALEHGQALKTVDGEKPKPEEKSLEKEVTWEERTKQAWERLRTGLTFETAKEETSAEEKTKDETAEPSLQTPASLPVTEPDKKAMDTPSDKKAKDAPTEQPSLLQSALAMLTSNPAKTEEVKGNESQPSQSEPGAVPATHPVPMQSYPPMMAPVFPYQMMQGQPPMPIQMQPYPVWNGMPLQATYQQMQLPMHPGSRPLQLPPGSPPLQMPMPQMMVMPQEKGSGILKQSSFDSRRVTFGERTEQTFVDDQDENLISPGKRKVFKGSKIITGLFGRSNTDTNKQSPSKEQSQGLQQTHTRSTDLSSCPSTYTLSEEWDGGPYLYSAGPVSPHVQAIVDNTSVDSGCLDTLSHLRMQVNRAKEGPQDPVGPIAV